MSVESVYLFTRSIPAEVESKRKSIHISNTSQCIYCPGPPANVVCAALVWVTMGVATQC